ncbi:hypothetical protein D3C73_1202580 [compost metagenome]
MPSNTGMPLQIHQSAKLTSAPSIIPAGMTNILTTVCSNPWPKKVRIGSHIAAILPVVDLEVIAITAPSVTIQLHRIALMKASPMPSAPMLL